MQTDGRHRVRIGKLNLDTVLGADGSTGFPMGAHCHFPILAGSFAIDQTKVMRTAKNV